MLGTPSPAPVSDTGAPKNPHHHHRSQPRETQKNNVPTPKPPKTNVDEQQLRSFHSILHCLDPCTRTAGTCRCMFTESRPKTTTSTSKNHLYCDPVHSSRGGRSTITGRTQEACHLVHSPHVRSTPAAASSPPSQRRQKNLLHDNMPEAVHRHTPRETANRLDQQRDGFEGRNEAANPGIQQAAVDELADTATGP